MKNHNNFNCFMLLYTINDTILTFEYLANGIVI